MITVTEAKSDAAQRIADFQIEMALETENLNLDPETVGKGVAAVFTDQSKGKYFVAMHGEEVVASLLTTFEWSDWRNGWVLWLQSVYVAPKYRNQGIFRQMYLHVKDYVSNTPHLKGIRLYVDRSNFPARAVYKALGMDGEHYQVFEWMKQSG